MKYSVLASMSRSVVFISILTSCLSRCPPSRSAFGAFKVTIGFMLPAFVGEWGNVSALVVKSSAVHRLCLFELGFH